MGIMKLVRLEQYILRRLLHGSEHGDGVLEVLLEEIVEADHRGAIDHAVVSGPRNIKNGRRKNLALLIEAGELADGTKGANGDLGGEDNGGSVGGPNAANVAEGERAALEVLTSNLAVLTLLQNLRELLGNLEQSLVLDILDVGNNEALGAIHGEANVVRALDNKLSALTVGVSVDLGELQKGEGGSLHEEGKEGDLRASGLEDGLEGLASADNIIHGDLIARTKGGDLIGDGHGPNHAAANASGKRNRVILRSSNGSGDSSLGSGRRRSSSLATLHVGDNVLLHNAASLAGGLNLGEINLVLHGDAASGRSGKNLTIVGNTLLGSGGGGGSRGSSRLGDSGSGGLLDGLAGGAVVNLEVSDRLADESGGALGNVHGLNNAIVAAGDLNGSLIGLNLADLIKSLDGIALLNEHLKNLNLKNTLTNIGQVKGDDLSHEEGGARKGTSGAKSAAGENTTHVFGKLIC